MAFFKNIYDPHAWIILHPGHFQLLKLWKKYVLGVLSSSLKSKYILKLSTSDHRGSPNSRDTLEEEALLSSQGLVKSQSLISN